MKSEILIATCIEALKPRGDVLEVGFDAAEMIHAYHPHSHTILAADPQVAKKARAWAEEHPHVTVIEKSWHEALDDLGIFDSIFFGDVIMEMQRETKEASTIVSAGQRRIEEVAAKIPFLRMVKYSNQDLEFLLTFLRSQGALEGPPLIRFLLELERDKQISTPQLETLLKRLEKEKVVTAKMVAATRSIKVAPKEGSFAFLMECLKTHMRDRSRFTTYFWDPTSKFEDDQYLNQIIANPFIDYKEMRIGDAALIITVEKI